MSTATHVRPAPRAKDWAVPNLQRGLAILEYLASGRHDASITERSASLDSRAMELRQLRKLERL